MKHYCIIMALEVGKNKHRICRDFDGIIIGVKVTDKLYTFKIKVIFSTMLLSRYLKRTTIIVFVLLTF